MDNADNNLRQLAGIPASERVLLLPHCLRQSNDCRAKYNTEGLQCAGCNERCAVNQLRSAALKLGYKGVCVAPGGHLALKFVKEKRPSAIVAVACDKELKEGIQGVQGLETQVALPLIVIVPLSKDGCIDTEVDLERTLEVLTTGCAILSNSGT